MAEKSRNDDQPEDTAAFNRRFKYAVIVFAIVEFIVIAFVVYKARR